MRLRTAAFVTAAALALASVPGAAQESGQKRHGPDHGEMGPMLHILKDIGLNDAQLGQVHGITAKYMDGALGQAMRSMRAARGTEQKTIHDVTATDQQVREAAASVALLESEMAVQHHRMAIEISSILTAEQRTKLAEAFDGMKERHAGPPPDDSGGL